MLLANYEIANGLGSFVLDISSGFVLCKELIAFQSLLSLPISSLMPDNHLIITTSKFALHVTRMSSNALCLELRLKL